MAHTITTKYNHATGKITAKCWRKTIRVDGYYTHNVIGDLAAHKEAAQELVRRMNEACGSDDQSYPWVIIAEAEGLKANEYTFIISTISQPQERYEYRVEFAVDTLACSYESAAKWVKETYFKQGQGEHFEVKRKGDKYPVEVDL